jgi:hypothetical protein
MPKQETTCAGCGGTISVGEMIWVSEIGEEECVITHPLPECLKKYISPEIAFHISESTITAEQLPDALRVAEKMLQPSQVANR